MTPKHGNFVPQTTEAPVKIFLSKTQINAGESINFRIESIGQGFQYKGLIIQPRDSGDAETVVGTLSKTGDDAQIIDCGGLNTATHVNFEPKTVTSLIWTAPQDFAGKIRFQ